MESVTYTIPNISCGHCLHTIKTELGELDGVLSVDGDVEKKVVTITYNAPIDEESVLALLKEINYPAI
jgi:copper chaperone CopZ